MPYCNKKIITAKEARIKMSKKASNILILSLVAVTIIGIIVGIWVHTSQQKFINEKTFFLNEKERTELDVRLSGVYPGMSVPYTVKLKANKGDSFNLTVDFQKVGKDSLASFIDVELFVNSEKIDSAKLSEYLSGRQVDFSVDFDGTENAEVEIVYSMGLDVGDEAQNTAADFDVVISAERIVSLKGSLHNDEQ